MRLSLALSVTLNLFLLTSIVAARIDPSRGPDPDSGRAFDPVAIDASPTEGREALAIEDLLAVLGQTALRGDDLKPLVLGWLEAEYRTAAYEPGPGYWERDYLPGRDSLAAELATEEAVRGALLDLFGAAAADDPAFDAVFRPLGPSYAFLGAAAQGFLRQRQLESLDAAPVDRGDRAGALLCRQQGPAGPDIRTSGGFETSGLGEAEELEYRLRFSPLAAQLREAGVARDEAEFRELFSLLRQLERNATPAEQAAIRADLRSRIGDDRFARFWSVRDPLFAPIDEYLTRRGFARHEVLAAYSIVNRSQEALLETIGRPTGDGPMMTAVRQVAEDEASRLATLLGREAADGLGAAMSGVALRLSQGSLTGC